MSLVRVLNVQVLDNPTTFKSPFKFEITFECCSQLSDDLEWKLIYVGSANSKAYDQVLDTIVIGKFPIGIVNKFIFQTNSPNPSLIPPAELRGVTVVLLICSFLDQEFIRVGYYVDNDYDDPLLLENPPEPPQIDLLKRNILADKPRVTRINIKWDPSQLSASDLTSGSSTIDESFHQHSDRDGHDLADDPVTDETTEDDEYGDDDDDDSGETTDEYDDDDTDETTDDDADSLDEAIKANNSSESESGDIDS